MVVRIGHVLLDAFSQRSCENTMHLRDHKIFISNDSNLPFDGGCVSAVSLLWRCRLLRALGVRAIRKERIRFRFQTMSRPIKNDYGKITRGRKRT